MKSRGPSHGLDVHPAHTDPGHGTSHPRPATRTGRKPVLDGGERVRLALVGLSVLTLALISGFFYAYACSVMIGLAQVDDRTFITTMQSINATIRNWGFGPAFFGAFLLTAAAVAAHIRRYRSPEWALLAVALLLYTVGGLGLTMTVSVPLNDELAAAGPVSAMTDPARVRADYEGPWVTWNLIRTACSTLAFLLAATALHQIGRTTRPNPAAALAQ